MCQVGYKIRSVKSSVSLLGPGDGSIRRSPMRLLWAYLASFEQVKSLMELSGHSDLQGCAWLDYVGGCFSSLCRRFVLDTHVVSHIYSVLIFVSLLFNFLPSLFSFIFDLQFTVDMISVLLSFTFCFLGIIVINVTFICRYPDKDLMNSGSTSSSLRAAFSYCVQQVRSYDYHHYLCLLELPPSMRKAAFALRALNVETARAMDVASDPRIGLMRLVWWQEAIDKIYANKLIEHPTAQALSSVIAESKLSKTWLKRSIEARIKDARREATEMPETMEEMEKYSEDTTSTMLYLTLQAGGIRSTAADHAASHIGKASGIVLLLKSLPYHISRNRHFSYVPAKLASKHGLLVKEGRREEMRLDSREALCDTVFEMASVANAHLEKARKLAAFVPSEAVPVLLPAVPAQILLDSLNRVQFDVFDPRLARGVLGISPLWYQLKLKWTSWRRKY